MKLTRNFQPRPGIMQFVALIDVVFLLLIFFLLASQAVVQPGLAVSPPYSVFSLTPLQRPQIITITALPEPAIYFRTKRVTLETLQEHLDASDAKDRSLVIKADRDTPYELVVEVSNACLIRGFTVALATSREAP